MVHGKSSFLIPRFIICQNLLLNVEENSWNISWQLQCKHHDNSCATDMATFNQKKFVSPANNVNCKEMRFVIRNLVDVDDVSPATAPEIGELPGDYLDVILPGNSASNSFWCVLELRQYFPKGEGMMENIKDRYFPQWWDQGYRTSRRTTQHYLNDTCTQITNTCNPTR